MPTRPDGTNIPRADALPLWAAAARDVLEEKARAADIIKYGDLADAVQDRTGIRTDQLVTHWIGRVLALVSDTQPVEEPALTSLVIAANGWTGHGYDDAIARREGQPPADREDHAAVQRVACYRHHGADVPDDLERVLAPAPRRRQDRAAGRTGPPPAFCPDCFVQLSRTGTCPQCGEDLRTV